MDATLLKLADSEGFNIVVVGSGHGDGGYPAFWVFGAQDRLISLVVDFQVAAEYLTRRLRIPWKPGVMGIIHDETKSKGPRVRIDREKAVAIQGGNVQSIR